MRDAQHKVDRFVAEHNVRAGAVTRVLDTQSELGEVAKEIIHLTDYGRRPMPDAVSPELRDEMGDLLFVILCLANELGLDLDAVLEEALTRYRLRFSKPGNTDSEGE